MHPLHKSRDVFSFFIPDVKKEDLKDFRYFFRDKLQTGLGAVAPNSQRFLAVI